jgi:hypothetical protein
MRTRRLIVCSLVIWSLAGACSDDKSSGQTIIPGADTTIADAAASTDASAADIDSLSDVTTDSDGDTTADLTSDSSDQASDQASDRGVLDVGMADAGGDQGSDARSESDAGAIDAAQPDSPPDARAEEMGADDMSSQPVLVVSSTTAQPGGTANLTVHLVGSTADPVAFQFDLAYDTSALTNASTDAGIDSQTAGTVVQGNMTGGLWRIVGFSTTNAPILDGNNDGRRELAVLKLRVDAGTLSGNYPLTLQNVVISDGNALQIAATNQDGSVQVP